MQKVRNLLPEEIEDSFEAAGLPRYRGRQVFKALSRGVSSWEEISGLPKSLRASLEEKSALPNIEMLMCQESDIDGSKKYLFRQPADKSKSKIGHGDKEGDQGLVEEAGPAPCIESVFMRHDYGETVCISSQAGCRMACSFCASTLNGLDRNLEAWEMLEQVRILASDNDLDHPRIVVMGMGEPFDNYENLKRFIELVSHPEGMDIGMRRITVSTCGIVPKIDEFGDDFPQVNLAISLHAPNDELRRTIMPVTNRYPIADLLDACDRYVDKTGRRVTYEYALLAGINDGEEEMKELAGLMKGRLAHVNFIPINRVGEIALEPTPMPRAREILADFQARGLAATLRKEMGADIQGACGQLRLSERE